MFIQTGSFSHQEQNPPDTTGGIMTSFHEVSFEVPFPKGVVPIVIPFVQTFNSAVTPGLRVAEISHNGFLVRINTLITSKGSLSETPKARERIGWVAISPHAFRGCIGQIQELPVYTGLADSA